MLAFTHSNIHETIVISLLVVEARLAVLVGALTLAEVDDFTVLGIPVVSIGLLGFHLLLDELHFVAITRDLVLAHRGVLHSDPHQ